MKIQYNLLTNFRGFRTAKAPIFFNVAENVEFELIPVGTVEALLKNKTLLLELSNGNENKNFRIENFKCNFKSDFLTAGSWAVRVYIFEGEKPQGVFRLSPLSVTVLYTDTIFEISCELVNTSEEIKELNERVAGLNAEILDAKSKATAELRVSEERASLEREELLKLILSLTASLAKLDARLQEIEKQVLEPLLPHRGE